MHLPRWHHCDARGLSSPIQIGAKLGQRASFAQARKQLGHSGSPFQSQCRSCLARGRYQNWGSAFVRQASAQSQQEKGQGNKPGSPKAGRGQVGLFRLLYVVIAKPSLACLLCICSFAYDAVSPTATTKDHILMPTILLHQACAWRLPMKALPQPSKHNNQTTPKHLMHCKTFAPEQYSIHPSYQRLATYLQPSGILCMLSHV